MFPFPALNHALRTVESITCPATAALEILISKQKQADSKATRQPFRSSQQKSTSTSTSTSTCLSFETCHYHPMEEDNHGFPLIQWYAGDDGSAADERDTNTNTNTTTARPLVTTILGDHVKTTDAHTDENPITAGKRSRSGLTMSKTQLVRSIALNSHLSLLLEASIQPLQPLEDQDSRTVSSSESSSSTNSLSQKFDVEKWLELAALDLELADESSGIFASSTKMRKACYRQQSNKNEASGIFASPTKMRKAFYRHQSHRNEASGIFASPAKMRKAFYRQQSLNTSMYGLALVT
jgi:hypothetical protein